MHSVKRIQELPDDCDIFIDEIARGLAELYGAPAAEAYLRKAYPMLEATLDHPAVEAWATVEGGHTSAMLFTILRGSFGQVSFVHVLRAHAGRDLESTLFTQAVESLRARGAQAIVCECLPSCPIQLDACAAALRFQIVPRKLMRVSLDAPALALLPDRESRPITRQDWQDVAALIGAAYEDHPDRLLHREVHDTASALQFVQMTLCGAYGPTDSAYCRLIRREGRAAGAIFGCEVAPGTGFVLQVAVHPEFQGQGIGGRLLREQAEWFRRAGMDHAALGVTAANPALRLYERLGYTLLRPVTAYAWHADRDQRDSRQSVFPATMT